jgi:hypothetical protein
MRILCPLILSWFVFIPSAHTQAILNPEWTRQVFSVEEGSATAWDLDVDADGMILLAGKRGQYAQRR